MLSTQPRDVPPREESNHGFPDFPPSPPEQAEGMGESLLLCEEIIQIFPSPKYEHLTCLADLKAVRTKLDHRECLDSGEFADDVRNILSNPDSGDDKSTPNVFHVVLDEIENLWTAVFLKDGPTPTENLEEDVGDESVKELSLHFKKMKESCYKARNVMEQCSLAARLLLTLEARRRRLKQCGEPLTPIPQLALNHGRAVDGTHN